MTQENTSGDVRSAAQDKPQIPQNEVTISDLAKKILATDKQYDLSKILSAYQLAEKAHAGQKRSSGEPYIIHPGGGRYSAGSGNGYGYDLRGSAPRCGRGYGIYAG